MNPTTTHTYGPSTWPASTQRWEFLAILEVHSWLVGSAVSSWARSESCILGSAVKVSTSSSSATATTSSSFVKKPVVVSSYFVIQEVGAERIFHTSRSLWLFYNMVCRDEQGVFGIKIILRLLLQGLHSFELGFSIISLAKIESWFISVLGLLPFIEGHLYRLRFSRFLGFLNFNVSIFIHSLASLPIFINFFGCFFGPLVFLISCVNFVLWRSPVVRARTFFLVKCFHRTSITTTPAIKLSATPTETSSAASTESSSSSSPFTSIIISTTTKTTTKSTPKFALRFIVSIVNIPCFISVTKASSISKSSTITPFFLWRLVLIIIIVKSTSSTASASSSTTTISSASFSSTTSTFASTTSTFTTSASASTTPTTASLSSFLCSSFWASFLSGGFFLGGGLFFDVLSFRVFLSSLFLLGLLLCCSDHQLIRITLVIVIIKCR